MKMVTMKITKTNFGITINDTLITDFRDVVNERDFVYSYFINRNGKNQFSPVLSKYISFASELGILNHL